MNDVNRDNEIPEGDSGTRDRTAGGDHGGETEALRRRLDAANSDAEALKRLLHARQRESDRLRAMLVAALGTLREQLERVESSAAWRYGHRASRLAARARGRRLRTEGGIVAALGQVDRILELLGAIRETEPEDDDAPAHHRAPGAADRERLAQRARGVLGEPPELRGPPRVAAVVVSRSRARVEKVMAALAETDYPSLELVVVDNASPGGFGSLPRTPIPVTTERLEAPASFAAASNRGAVRSDAELLLFLNDDVQPVEPGWLRQLVAPLLSGAAEIVGATIVQNSLTDTTASGWQLEQRGIAFAGGDALAPIRRDAGEDPLAGDFDQDIPSVAVSGACLLITRAVFGALGEFDTGYHYGLEDVDLCLRARARGHRVLCSGRALVLHEGSSSQRAAGREFRRINRAINRQRFHQLWGPAVRRERLAGLLDDDAAWAGRLHLAIARTSNDPDRGWGDYHTAAELGEAAEALGWTVSYLAHQLSHTGADRQRHSEIPADLDVVVLLTDGWDVREFPATTVKCAWIRNWTERWLERPWFDDYDVLLASSGRSATLLREATGRPVELFPLATNSRRFHPPPQGNEPQLDWVLTANRWGEPREIETALAQRTADAGAIYGRGWEQVRQLRSLARGSVPYDELPAIYGTARIVLDDTASPTLAYEAVNSRVFDALACGSLVLTNCAGGVRELFDEEFPTWSSPEELGAQLERMLRSPEQRAALAARYRREVLERHTYEERASRLRSHVRRENERASFCLKIGAPDAEQARRWGDLHVAAGLGRALRRLGHRWRVETLDEWDSTAGSTFDVAIHLRGRSEYQPQPGQFNVLWLISHPETLDLEIADGYDLVCVASEPFAAELEQRLSAPVRVLNQATDPRLFFHDPDSSLSHQLVFVGNSRGVSREILDDLLPTCLDLAVWGMGWMGTPVERHLVAEHVPNHELRRVYSSAGIVLCDHWPDMRAAGFRSNRLYDALACDALVVCDRVAGLDGSLSEAVVTYEDGDELEPLLERLLADPAERAARVRDARERILAGETFDHRARALTRWVEEVSGRKLERW